MPRIVVNGKDQPSDSGLRTWGDVLDRVERALSPTGEVVTEARLDGVDQPTFREPSVMQMSLDDIDLVEVESARPAVLAARSLGEAVVALETLQRASGEIAQGFRGHDLESANRGLAELADGLRMLAALIGAVSLGLRFDLQALGDETDPVNTTIADLSSHVDALIAAQRNADWVAVADILQYDVEPALSKWRPVLDRFLASVSETSPRQDH